MLVETAGELLMRGQPCWSRVARMLLVFSSQPRNLCRNGNTHRNVLKIGRLHQQSAAQPQCTAPIASTNRPMTAKSR